MAALTNSEMWNLVRNQFPEFKSHTAEATAEMFTERGFEALKRTEFGDMTNEFFNLTLRIYLQKINIAQVEDTLSTNGFGEYYDTPFGGLIQRMATGIIKPISAQYRNFVNGASIDPFKIRKPEANDRFFKHNFDYQSLITIPDEWMLKNAFINEGGIAELMGGIMSGLKAGYTIQNYTNKLEAINSGLNSTKYPLKDTQKLIVRLSADPTDAELREFILSVNNLIDNICMGPANKAFNSMSYETIQDRSRLKMLVRPGLKNAIKVRTLAGAFNKEELSLGIDIIEVPHFGGLVPFADSEHTTPLYPVYDSFGTCIGFNTTEGADTVTVAEDEAFYSDPNADVIAVIADKGWLFYNQQNPYTVEPIRNPAGRYTNFWASSPNNGINIDPIYNVVEIKNS